MRGDATAREGSCQTNSERARIGEPPEGTAGCPGVVAARGGAMVEIASPQGRTRACVGFFPGEDALGGNARGTAHWLDPDHRYQPEILPLLMPDSELPSDARPAQ